MTVSTEAIWGLRAFEKCCPEHYAEWATGKLSEGFDSKNLRILAGIETLSSIFEAEDYFQRAINELGLKEPPKEDALEGYALYIAEQIVERQVPAHEGVKKLFRLCCDCDYPKHLMIWFKLDDACDDVLCGSEPFTYPRLTKENLEEMVIKEARLFIEKQSE